MWPLRMHRDPPASALYVATYPIRKMCQFLIVRPVCPTCLRLLPDDDVHDPLITDPYPFTVCDVALRDQRLCPEDHMEEDYVMEDHINVIGSIRCQFCRANNSARILHPLAETELWREENLPDRPGTQALRILELYTAKHDQAQALLAGEIADAVTPEVKDASKPIPPAARDPPMSREYLRDIYTKTAARDAVHVVASADPWGDEISRIRGWAAYGRLDQSTSVLAERLLAKFWNKPAFDGLARSRISAACLYIACDARQPEDMDVLPVVCGRSEKQVDPVLKIINTLEKEEVTRTMRDVAEAAGAVGPHVQGGGGNQLYLPVSPDIIRHVEPRPPYEEVPVRHNPHYPEESDGSSAGRSDKENHTPESSGNRNTEDEDDDNDETDDEEEDEGETDDDENDSSGDSDGSNGGAPLPDNRPDTPDSGDRNGPIARPPYIRTQHAPLPYVLPADRCNWATRSQIRNRPTYATRCSAPCLSTQGQRGPKSEERQTVSALGPHRKRKSDEISPTNVTGESEAPPNTKRRQIERLNATPDQRLKASASTLNRSLMLQRKRKTKQGGLDTEATSPSIRRKYRKSDYEIQYLYPDGKIRSSRHKPAPLDLGGLSDIRHKATSRHVADNASSDAPARSRATRHQGGAQQSVSQRVTTRSQSRQK